MASRAEHLPETQLALRDQFRILAPRGHNRRRNLIRCKRLGFLSAEISCERAKLRFGKPKLGHARLFFGLVAVDGDVAFLVHDRPRLFQPLVNPFAADFCADAGKVGAEHRGPLDSLQFVAPLAIQLRQDLATACKLRRLREFGLMTGAARSLKEVNRERRLLPRESRFVSFGDFRGRALPAMTNRAAPIADVVRNWRMRTERLWNRFVHEAG